ncbi:MAG: hypothetical protein LC687_04605 [Actinobacteria bacterium]|nr:hypothetical protein [Actinomycetota bacterium]MCA1807114.1 hypothetical protein [Actinomycetota bacterium]
MSDLAKDVAHYISLRDERSRLKKEFEEADRSLRKQMDDIELKVMTKADELGVDNFKTPAGTAFRNVKQSYNVVDWEGYLEWAVENDALHTIQRRVTKSAVDEAINELGIEIPPGLDLHTEVKFNFRK